METAVDAGIAFFQEALKKEEDKPILYVFNAASRQTVPIMGSIYLLTTTVSNLKTLVTRKCGFPVSVYCLRTPRGQEMYDGNTLSDYKLDIGDTVRMDVWDKWREFLNGCLLGHKHTVQLYSLKEEFILRYQHRVALYMTAFFSHLDLAEWLLQQGAKADEAVDIHPYREWCCETKHPDFTKCPIHVAAETGQLLMLKTFVTNNVACLECENSLGKSPLKICIENRHKDCVLYLIMKIWSMVSFPKLSIPMRIYVKLKKWLHRAQKHILARKCPRLATGFRTRVGDTVVIDGFTKPKMTSKGFYTATNKRTSNQLILTDPPFARSEQMSKENRLLKKSIQAPKLPILRHVNSNQASRQNKGVRRSVDENKRSNMWAAQVPLPPIASNMRPPFYYTEPQAAQLLSSSLEPFSENSGRTPRENAIYCLALASEFKEKPWLQQLIVARVLARNTICKLAS